MEGRCLIRQSAKHSQQRVEIKRLGQELHRLAPKGAGFALSLDRPSDATYRLEVEGRPERKFETTLGKNGAIKTAAMVGGGGMMDVIGQIKEGDSKILLTGYCKFEGKLTKK